MQKNIIHIIIDSLRYDHLNVLLKNYKDMIPNINRAREYSICYESYFANGAPTEMALPSIFSSSYPLDFGGYDLGMSNRPTYFQEILGAENYYTCGVFTCSPEYNVPRGYIESYNQMTELVQIKFKLRNIVKNLWRCKEIIDDEVIELFDKMIDSIYQSNSQKYGKKIRERYIKNKFFFILSTAIKHCFFGLLNYYITKLSVKKGYNKQIKLFRIYQSITIGSNADTFIKRYYPLRGGVSPYISGKKSVEILKKKICSGMNSTYLFAHLMDVHERNYISYDSNDEDLVEKEYEHATKIIKELVKQGIDGGDAERMAAVVYIDKFIGMIINKLRECNLLNSTIIIISADHGREDLVNRDGAHVAKDFFDEIYHIPLFIYDGENRYDDERLMSAIDFAPTVLDILKIKQSVHFKGKSFYDMNYYSVEKNDMILMEDTGRGKCDPLKKVVTVCIRSKFWKVVYKDKLFDKFNENNIYQIFDLVNDPKEYVNLSTDENALKSTAKLIDAARNRIEELRMQYGKYNEVKK